MPALLLLIPPVTLLTGCSGKDSLDVSVKLDSPIGLQSNTPVLMGEQTIGTVTGIKPNPPKLRNPSIKPKFMHESA